MRLNRIDFVPHQVLIQMYVIIAIGCNKVGPLVYDVSDQSINTILEPFGVQLNADELKEAETEIDEDGYYQVEIPQDAYNRILQPDIECNNEPKELVFYLKEDQTVIDILHDAKSNFDF